MTAIVTERRRKTFQTKDNSDGRTNYASTRTFDISGVTSVADAEAALYAQKGIERGSASDDASAAIVTDITTERVTPDFYTSTVNYSNLNGGTSSLLEPKTLKFEPYTYTTQESADVDGNPFVNTVGFLFEGGFSQEHHGLLITISQWESIYTPTKNFTYGGKTNLGVWTLPNGQTLAEGQAKFIGIFQGEKATNSTVVRCEYRFDCRAEGWDRNIIDQGDIGYTTVEGFTGAGNFKNGWQDIPNVLLDGTGKPIDENVKVAQPGQSPSDAEEPPTPSPSQGLVNPDLSKPTITVLTFKGSKRISFDAILS